MLAGTSSAVVTTIPESLAPIVIDQCVVSLRKTPTGYVFLDSVDFSNISQRTATEVRFAFKVFDANGRIGPTVMEDDQVGRFAPGAAISHSTAAPTDSGQAPQTIDAIPASSKVACSVQMVRFDDGSVWNYGDEPVGSGAMFTPLPQPSATPAWHFPGDGPTPG